MKPKKAKPLGELLQIGAHLPSDLKGTFGMFPAGGVDRHSTIRSASVGVVRRSSVTACVSTADSTLMVGRGLSRVAIVAAAT